MRGLESTRHWESSNSTLTADLQGVLDRVTSAIGSIPSGRVSLVGFRGINEEWPVGVQFPGGIDLENTSLAR